MCFRLIKSPFENDFKTFLGKTKKELVLSSPYINESGVNIFLDSIYDKSKVKVNILTNLSTKNIVDNVTQPTALLKIYNGFREINISSLAKLHAKVYIIDGALAMITSANLTYSGIKNNFEYGVVIENSKVVRLVKKDILNYANFGNIIDRNLLEKINEKSKKIERIKTKQQQKLKNTDLAKLMRQTEENINAYLLENRIKGGKTINEIFSNTILYLLSKHKQLTTDEINNFIQEIYPDICDDSIHRVINGQDFGKFWKHSVRNAQTSLKKNGLINNSGKPKHQIWFLT